VPDYHLWHVTPKIHRIFFAFSKESSDISSFYRVVASVFHATLTSVSGHAVAQLIEELRYKSEGRWFDFQ
jgi:hypothetical protein